MEPRKKPADGTFQQQRLRAWQPLLTPPWVSASFAFIFLLFIILGNVILTASKTVVQVKVRYDNQCDFNTTCHVSVAIPKEMKPPVFFYYELTNFNQNHRRYVKSRADAQLRGVDVLNGLTACDPLISYNGSTLYPCGLVANSFFNDTFSGSYCKKDSNNCTAFAQDVEWTEKDIAWPTDKEVKFKAPSTPMNTSIGPGGFQLPPVTDEHFIVWMRTSGLPVFKKLYARLPSLTLNEGDILNVTVLNVFPVSQFSGEKAIVLSTTSWIGGKNEFLGTAYIVVGSICGFLAFAFALKHYFRPRKLGDMKYFNWRKPPTSYETFSPSGPASPTGTTNTTSKPSPKASSSGSK